MAWFCRPPIPGNASRITTDGMVDAHSTHFAKSIIHVYFATIHTPLDKSRDNLKLLENFGENSYARFKAKLAWNNRKIIAWIFPNLLLPRSLIRLVERLVVMMIIVVIVRHWTPKKIISRRFPRIDSPIWIANLTAVVHLLLRFLG